MKIELPDEAVDKIVEAAVSHALRDLEQSIKKLKTKKNLSSLEKADLDFWLYYRDGLSRTKQYFKSN